MLEHFEEAIFDRYRPLLVVKIANGEDSDEVEPAVYLGARSGSR